MTLQEFRDEVRGLFDLPFLSDFYVRTTPDDEYLCAAGYIAGSRVKLTYCEGMLLPYAVIVAGRTHAGSSLKEAFARAAEALSSVAAKMLEVAR